MNAMSTSPPLKLRSTIIQKPDGMQITIPISKGSAWLLGSLGSMFALVMGLILWPGGAAAQFSRSSSDQIVILFLFSTFALEIGALFCAFGGHTVLFLGTDCLVVKRGVFGFGWTRKLDVSDLFNLRSYRELTNDSGATYTVPGVLVDYRGNIYRFSGSMFGGNLSRGEAEYLVSQIKMHYPSVNVLPNAPGEDPGTLKDSLLHLLKNRRIRDIN